MTGVSIPDRPLGAGRSGNLARRAALTIRARRSQLALGALLLVVALAQGYNMTHFPHFGDDEGTYLSQAWAVFHLGSLAPSAYIYDHPPLGWIQLAIWQLLSGTLRLRSGLSSGRTLMLLLQLGSAWLVFRIGSRASGRAWVGLLAAALASLLPFGLLYHRRILLDNICAFWLLVSLYALCGRITLRRVWFSAVALGFAVLSKEIALAAVPALAVLVARRSPRENRLFAVSGWLTLSLSICSIYVLLALIKGELFPAGSALGGMHPHVSLICTLLWQASRGSDAGIADPSSGFWHTVAGWVRLEPVLTIGGVLGVLYLITLRRRNAFLSMLGWMVISLVLFLGRGGIVLDFYLLPLLPLLALAIALALGEISSATANRIGSRAAPRGVVVLGLAAVTSGAVLAYHQSGGGLWSADPVKGQDQAVNWVERHLPADSRIVIDDYMSYDLHLLVGRRPFRDAIYYWNAEYDPRVRRQVFDDNWRQVDYVITTPGMRDEIAQHPFSLIGPALQHSVLVRSFDTGNWPVQVRRVEPKSPTSAFAVGTRPDSEPRCMRYQ